MPLIPASSSYGAGSQLPLASSFNALVGQDVSVWSTDAMGIVGAFSNHEVTVAGTVFGYLSGVSLGDNALLDKGAKVIITAGGAVMADQITLGMGIAVYLRASAAQVLNDGLIAGRVGVYLGGFSGASSQIINNGDILGNSYGIQLSGAATEKTLLVNTGAIRGALFSYQAAVSAQDIITNRGEMLGHVDLAGGDDLYDGLRGRVIGVVTAGEGNDVMRPGLAVDSFDGGAGVDTLDFGGAAGTNFSLTDPGFGTGVALDDIYFDFENLTGSLLGADHLIGDNGRNTLRGQGGNDTLNGAGERDTFVGGLGRDSLVGGAGNDIFIFQRPNEGGDMLADFSRASGNADYLRIIGAGFGGGLTRGTLAESKFVIGTGNRGLDRDDRFVFRTTDKTLWFDVDGSGRKRPVLIATIGTDVALMSSDIFIV